MFVLFKRQLRNNWLMILGWGLGLGLLGFYLFDIFDSFFQQNVDLRQLFDVFPESLMAFFGGNLNLFEPGGFIHLEFFSYIPIILGIMVISSAVASIAKREEDGTLEIIIAQPISRTAVFWGRSLALILSIVLILVITWAGFALSLGTTTTIELEQSQLILPFITLLAVLLVYFGFALLLSMILPSTSLASLIAGLVLVASYFITSLANLDEKLAGVNKFSPLKYYQDGGAVSGLDLKSLAILVGLSLLFILSAWLIFTRRDLRFGGSGGLRLGLTHKKSGRQN